LPLADHEDHSMTCRQLAPDIVDLARGSALDPAREAAALRHVRECASCTARLEQERAISVALRRLATEGEPPPGDEGERKLLAAFDAARARPRRVTMGVRVPLAASVVIAAGLALSWAYGWSLRARPAVAPVAMPSTLATPAPQPPAPITVVPATVRPASTRRALRSGVARRAEPEAETAPFVVWAGASALPRFESGELIRIDIPESVLPELGLWPRPSDGRAIQADVLVGQDGLVRGVRFVP
jgi:hypothetical protein